MARTRPAAAPERLRRLLALVPWVVANDGPTIAEVCERFDVTEADLLEDLNTVFLCGVHPFTPDLLMEVDIVDGRVWIQLADYFERPLRLTPEEGLALVASGAALQAVPGADPAGPLARALDKVAAVLGIDASGALEVVLGTVPEDVLAVLREGIAAARQVEIDYYAYGRDERTVRTVDPWDVFTAAGEWYLTAWCHRAGGQRRFRIDRIGAARIVDTTFETPDVLPPRAVFTAGPDDPRVVLDLAPRARWVLEQYPVEQVEETPDGHCRVTLAVSEPAWLERLVLRLGPDVGVVHGPGDLAAGAARRILARYGDR
ncbi:MAG: WYL domain-containing protein [Acidimicrobiales bacterium]